MVKSQYQCPVCGYGMQDAPRDNNICASCGTEFGYHDSGRTFAQIRKEWIKGGVPWSDSHTLPPIDWNPYIQMLNAGLVDITFGGSENMTITLDTDGVRPAQNASNSVSTATV